MQTALADYDRVELQYRTWSRAWMHDENSPVYVPVDRMEVLDLVQEYLMPYGTVNTLVVDEDVMIVTMSDMNLEQISAMFQRLQLQPSVKAATLTLAATPSVNPGARWISPSPSPSGAPQKGRPPNEARLYQPRKILLVILAIMLIAVGYWKLILTPINDDIADLQSRTASEQDAMIQSAARLSQLNRMKSELERCWPIPMPSPCRTMTIPSGCWWS